MAEKNRIRHLACVNFYAGYKPDDYKSKNINFEVAAGELLAIIGPSGSGKSTLLQGMQGLAPFSKGEVWVNGKRCEDGLRAVRTHVGEVPQDDILVEEMSARENIRSFNTVAVDRPISGAEREEEITRILRLLGIEHVADEKLKAAGETRTKVSGGQRKRINIAMELINDPDVLIIDEPTSGLSSHDSLKLIQNLKSIATEGEQRIVIIIIHQPSAEVFSLFDRLIVLDGAGHCVCSGPRDEVIQRLKPHNPKEFEHRCRLPDGRAAPPLSPFADDTQAAAQGYSGQRFYFPDRILETIELRKERVEEEERKLRESKKRELTAEEKASFAARKFWSQESTAFAKEFAASRTRPAESPLPRTASLRPLEWLKDLGALVYRQALIKRRDRMQRLLTWGAPPALGLIMAIVFRSAPPQQDYAYATNAMFPQLLFMLVVCMTFLGMVGSIFEVIKDRGMLERETKRNLGMGAYLIAEFMTLALPTAIQSALLLGVALPIIGAPWTVLFEANWPLLYLAGLCAAASGLLISALIKSPIAAYNMIPLILIPQIILGGALMPFGNMGKFVYLGGEPHPDRQPAMSKVMPAAWAYEAMMLRSHDLSEAQGVEMNQALRSLESLRTGDFMALDGTLSVRGSDGKKGSTAGANAAVLGLVIVFLLLTAWIWSARSFDQRRKNAVGRWLALQALASSGVLVIGYYFLETTPARAPVDKPLSAPALPSAKPVVGGKPGAAKTDPGAAAKKAPVAAPPANAAAVPSTSTAAPARIQASFDCGLARSVIEKMICSSPELATLDREMGRLYSRVLARAREGNASQAEVDSFKNWHQKELQRRNALKSPSELRDFYTTHNQSMQTILCRDLQSC